MSDWIEPNDWRQWARRTFALQPLLLMLMAGALFVAELRFDWIERMLGAYLVSSNSQRPESGAIWEKGKKARTARTTLEQIVTDRQAVQREMRNVTSVHQLAESLAAGQGVIIAPEQFRRLFLRLPQAASRQMISVFELLRLSSSGAWRRTYIERTGNGMAIYLLDSSNRVLHQADISAAELNQMDDDLSPEPAQLDGLPQFQDRIYPAERFFDALQSFPEEVRRSVLPHPERLLAVNGQIRRVGISDETGAGYIELGFEISDGTQTGVLRIKGGEWSVWRLRSLLETRTARPPSDPSKEIGAPQ
jgi:hypothetical protein